MAQAIRKNDREENSDYFGKLSSSHYFVRRLKRGFVAMCVINVLLLGGLALMFQNSDKSAALLGTPLAARAVELPEPDKITILVATKELKEGSPLTAGMFQPLTVRADLVPPGVIREEDTLSVLGKYIGSAVNPGAPLFASQLLAEKASDPFHIPAGYRAVTINIDIRTGVEGFAKPNSRVDVLWFHSDHRGKQKVATIVRQAKILSVGGVTESDPQQGAVAQGATANRANFGTTATLLVTERDAHILELARNLGSLSLTLVGEEDFGKLSPGGKVVTERDIMRNARGQTGEEEFFDGSLTIKQPGTTKATRLVLVDGSWIPEKDGAAQEGAKNEPTSAKSR